MSSGAAIQDVAFGKSIRTGDLILTNSFRTVFFSRGLLWLFAKNLSAYAACRVLLTFSYCSLIHPTVWAFSVAVWVLYGFL